MKRRVLVLAVLLIALGACSNQKKQEGKEPPVPPEPMVASGSAEAPKQDPKLVERGEYLAGMLGCGFCHVGVGPTGPDMTKQFVGGLEVPEKFGTWRSPNITQDKETGIGGWTDAQIDAAIRMGTRPDNSQLYPIMPYMNYNRMTDDDSKALVAYLRTIKPVSNKVERTKDLALPKMTPPKPTNAPDLTGEPIKHGEYLVTIMHCDNCHTPMGPTGPDRSKLFAGGMEFEIPFLGTGKLYGSNLTSDPETGLGKWSQADIEKAVKFMQRPDATIIQGPMQFYLAGWSKLTDNDINAIGTFIKKLPPIKNKVPKSTFKPNPPPGAAGSGSAGSGSAAKPAAGSGSAAPGSGSAAKPAAGSGAKPAAPAAGSGSAAKPAAGANTAPAAGSGSAK